jgi:hypothetical protein
MASSCLCSVLGRPLPPRFFAGFAGFPMLMGQDRAIGHLAQRQIVHRVRGNRPSALGRVEPFA